MQAKEQRKSGLRSGRPSQDTRKQFHQRWRGNFPNLQVPLHRSFPHRHCPESSTGFPCKSRPHVRSHRTASANPRLGKSHPPNPIPAAGSKEVALVAPAAQLSNLPLIHQGIQKERINTRTRKECGQQPERAEVNIPDWRETANEVMRNSISSRYASATRK